MKILIIGASGYIGNMIYQKLSIKHSVKCVDAEWFGLYSISNIKCNYSELSKSLVQDHDVVILTAAHSSVPMCNEDKSGAFDNNVVNFVKLVEKLRPDQKFIYASSSCVYLNSSEPAKEDWPLRPNDMLSFSKTTADNYLTAFNPCEYYALRFGSVNGWSPNLRTDLMINAMTMNAIKTNKVTVSNGDNYRPILGMLDLVRAVETIVEGKKDNRGIYNLASFNTKIRKAGQAVQKMFGCELVEEKGSGSYDFTINCDKFKSAFNFVFEETVESIVTSIRNYKDAIIERQYPERKVGSRNVSI